MAIGATCVWEVRTTGAATNGGGYTSGGTDYSQQVASQLDLTDLACLDTTVNLTSATGGFTAAMVGNIIHINSGTQFTAGFYEIKTRVDTNTVTIDRTAAVAGQNATAGVGSVGGAVDHPNTISTVVVAANTIYIKNGTYQKVGANTYILNITVAGSTTAWISWIGYETTRGDNPTANRPIFDGNSASATNCIVSGQTNNTYKNIICQNASGSGVSSTQLNYFENVVFSGNGAAGWVGSFNGGAYYFLNCEAYGNTTIGFNSVTGGGAGFFAVGCYSHNNTGAGFSAAAAGGNAFSCISESNSDDGFINTPTALNCIAYNNSGAANNGFNMGGSSRYINNISKGNGQYAFVGTSTHFKFFDYNCYNGHATELSGVTAGAHDVGDVDPLFTDAANGDFTLGAASPCKNTGFPTTSMAGATV